MEALLAETLDRVRRPAANLSALLEAAEPGAGTFARVESALREEVATLAAAVTDIARRHDRARAEDLPLAQTRASDLADGLGARLAAAGLFLSVATEPLLLRCNGFDIIDLLAAIAERMAAAGLARSFHLAIEEEDSGAAIRLGWAGPALPIAQLDRWLDEAADPALPAVRRRAVLRAHATEIWPERRGEGQVLCLPVPRARRETGRPAPLPRRLVYDFDLLAKARHDSLAESALEDLTYVVFDTETTGLLPRQGDAIVQIAAVRIVNGRRVAGEVFDTLVNPGRPIPAAATAVHGITGAMVEGAPRLPEAARRFHRFAEGAVLIAHNAPFDMAFLRRAEGQIGLRFDMPILDTVLLSAVLYGRHEVHSLDALAHRLGITIPEEARHTALGDAVATADAFLRMMPMLRGRGLCTFGAVLAEVRRHGRLLRDLNLGS
jgi:DNA polymerase-3 subunit epsilon